jgi:hypothetical protein
MEWLRGKLTVLLLMLTVLASCTSADRRVNLGGLDPGVEILRLDIDLFEIDVDSIPQQLPLIRERYGEFFDIFNNMIIRAGDPYSPAYSQHLKRFLTDFDIYRIYSETHRVFQDLTEIEAELDEAFRHYMHYFPGYTVPRLYTYISGFNQSVVTAEGIMGIGLDNYLGSDHFFYSELQLPNYQRYNMHPAKISSDCMIAWAKTEFEFDAVDDNLLSHVIYHGKLMFFSDAMFPDLHDTLKTGFSLSHLEWCRRNEVRMWTYLVENKLLFSTDARTISRFINNGPFTSEFTRDSPARAAVWLGWQIVKSYMSRHKDLSLEDLMLDNDYQGILNGARYRP